MYRYYEHIYEEILEMYEAGVISEDQEYEALDVLWELSHNRMELFHGLELLRELIGLEVMA